MSLAVESASPEASSADSECRSGTGEFQFSLRSAEYSLALVRAIQRGDTDAFGTLYARHHDEVRCYLQRLLGDRVAAEDFASETFVRALASIDRFGYAGSGFAAWLTTIARNVHDHAQRGGRLFALATIQGGVPGFGARTARGRWRRARSNLLDRGCPRAQRYRPVAANQWECVRLRFLQGRTVAETADTLGRSPAAVRQLQRRAIHNLAKVLDADSLRS